MVGVIDIEILSDEQRCVYVYVVYVLFSSRVPLYSEAKLAFFIYLWFPKTRVSTIYKG